MLDGFSFLECPRWHDGRLWVSDFYTNRVLATDGGGDTEVMAKVPGQPSGLGFLPDGRALIVSMRDHRILVRDDAGRLTEHADLSGAVPGAFNDMVVDERGRAYVGNFGFDLMGGAPLRDTTITRVDPDGGVTRAADGLGFPNGMVILPGGVLVAAETFAALLTAFDIQEDGTLANQRAWARFGEPPDTDDVEAALARLEVAPDGICADAEGAVWVADALHPRLLRVREGGEILEEIPTRMGVYARMLGGDDGRTPVRLRRAVLRRARAPRRPRGRAARDRGRGSARRPALIPFELEDPDGHRMRLSHRPRLPRRHRACRRPRVHPRLGLGPRRSRAPTCG